MKNKFLQSWLLQSIIVATLFFMFGKNEAHAAIPFQAGDFVSIAELGGLEVQKNEITYAQYSALSALLPVTSQAPCNAQDCYLNKYLKYGYGPNYPAACISYNDAKAYMSVLNSQDTNYSYRLPKDDELTKLKALTIRKDRSIENISRFAWFKTEKSKNNAHVVCAKEPYLGLCDILGNLWELNIPTSGFGPALSGGSWFVDASYVLANDRLLLMDDNQILSYRESTIGFRLVRTAK